MENKIQVATAVGERKELSRSGGKKEMKFEPLRGGCKFDLELMCGGRKLDFEPQRQLIENEV